jgi:predicted nucleic acid-binding protein
VVTLIELAHGAARADTSQRKEKRQQFIRELLTALPIHPVTVSLALRVGQFGYCSVSGFCFERKR